MKQLDAVIQSTAPVVAALGFTAKDAAALEAAAAALFSAGDFAAAASLARAATECDAARTDAWVILATACARQKAYSAAVTAYQRTLALRSNDVAAWVGMAEALIAIRDYRAASGALRQAMLLDPVAAEPAGRRARALVMRTLKALKGAAS